MRQRRSAPAVENVSVYLTIRTLNRIFEGRLENGSL